ncbi:MAG: hypothetical protein CMJ18_22155 [Phycisphaeraceae bacterium]|nr:hypothetical protein [Phycisphaeraceae bacterium]
MIYRMRTYRSTPDRIASSHEVFYEHVHPVHVKHGARFIGRWQTEDDRIVVIWEYDSVEECERIQKAVHDDPALVATDTKRKSSGLLGADREEILMTPTGG